MCAYLKDETLTSIIVNSKVAFLTYSPVRNEDRLLSDVFYTYFQHLLVVFSANIYSSAWKTCAFTQPCDSVPSQKDDTTLILWWQEEEGEEVGVICPQLPLQRSYRAGLRIPRKNHVQCSGAPSHVFLLSLSSLY